MNLKRLNNFFGISLSLIGLLKVILMVLIFVQSGIAATSMVTGGNTKMADFSIISKPLGIMQLILAVCSIVMIFVNIKPYPDVILGYIIGLIAVGLELILPPIVYSVYVFIESALYIKAGNKIRDKKSGFLDISNTKSKEEKVKSTDWFYKDDNEQ